MEELVGPEVEIILTLKEVTDLSFINTPVFIMAALLENQMETDVHEPETSIKFNTDLIWQTNKLNLKRMRNNNIPIKLSLFKLLSGNKREKFGYVILNLRTAQYVPKGKPVKITGTYVKILGLGKEAKGCFPHLLMTLRVQDKMSEDKISEKTEEGFQGISISNDSCVELGHIISTDGKRNENELQNNVENIIKFEGGDATGPQSPPKSPRSLRMKHSLSSNGSEKQACFSSYDTKNSSGDSQPQKRFVQAYHSYKLEISLKNIIWFKVPPKFNFRFHQSRSEVISTAHPEITIERANEDVELCDIKATFLFVETPADFFKLISTVPPVVSISSIVQNRPSIIARGILKTDKLMCCSEENTYNIDFVEVKNHEVLGRLCYTALLTDCGPQVMKDVTLKLKSPSSIEENDLPPVFFDSVTDKIVDELEEWKERQKDIFQQKFASKLKIEIQELRNEWTERKRELEEKLNEKMEQCRQLGDSLINATEDVKQKNREFIEKEKKLEATKSELEVRYFNLLTEKNEETGQLRMELDKVIKENDERISRLEGERNEQEKSIKILQAENVQLKEALKMQEAELEKNKRACLSQEQTATLLQDLKTMQEKLESANNSKLFFKEQWGRAVREIHRIKSEYSKNIQIQLQYRKDELKKLGLEQFFVNEKNKNMERDDLLEAKDLLGSDFEVRSCVSDLEFPYMSKTSFKTNMDIVRESNTYLLKSTQENEDRLRKLIEERDKLLGDGLCQIDDEKVVKLNKEIRHLLEH